MNIKTLCQATARSVCALVVVLCAAGPVVAGGAADGEGNAAGEGEGGPQPIRIGLSADMSLGAARAGESIRRGIVLAMERINRKGGVLGRPLALTIRDHHGNPARGVDDVEAFADDPAVVAVFAGLHTPVALAQLDAVHERGVPLLVPWAAGTPVVDNGRDPNFVFRVSARDEYVGGFLVERALERGYRSPALLLERTGWGRSNERAMRAALEAHGLAPATVQWFHWSIEDVKPQLEEIRASGADCIMLVANPREGATIVKGVTAMPADQRLPIVSHWGITGGSFFEQTEAALRRVDLRFVQTFLFTDPPDAERAAPVIRAYLERFDDADEAADIFAPAGTAHAWDLTHLLAQAIENAGEADRDAVRDALERLDPWRGLVRRYDPPFTPERHDALTPKDLRLARFGPDGEIIPSTHPDQPDP